jgi:hypothetical protein
VTRWAVETFPSGTHIVARRGFHRRAPHYYVYEAPGLTRMETCEQLAAWLNGDGPRPAWADTLIRGSETAAHFPALNEHGSPLLIYATGPYVESDPGRGDWRDDKTFRDERADLMDVLCGTRRAPPKEE